MVCIAVVVTLDGIQRRLENIRLEISQVVIVQANVRKVSCIKKRTEQKK